MPTDFQIIAVSREKFAHLFSLTGEELAQHHARRVTVDAHPGYPCRVSLADAALGEEVILTPFKHQDSDSPYRAGGPIFVRESAETARLERNEVPPMLRRRHLSVRAYDKADVMIGAELVDGERLDGRIRTFFRNTQVHYLHIHNAAPGCFNCLVERVLENSIPTTSRA